MIKDYVKKQVTIQAMEWTGENVEELEYFTEDQDNEKWFREFDEYGEQHLYIFTLEGSMKANIGDYIIKGVKGEFYPCKPDIFKMTYEELEAKKENNEIVKTYTHEVRAIQFLGNPEEIKEFLGEGMHHYEELDLIIPHDEGDLVVNETDYLLKEKNGKIYALEESDFKKLYREK